ncbi:hypothetical protein BSKO_09138 [Bryopsis sp. KO-2023]|nr:hypothetical protein BSKO_09138 [Bryopsis sp. KO-2023]
MGVLSILDVVVVVMSLLGVFGVAMYSTYKQKTSGGAERFFLAGRSMPWWIIGGSLFASNIGTEHFVGQAGTAASAGIAVGLYEWTAGYMILALGWIFAPVYLRCKLTTIPELLEHRFNKECRFVFVIITLLAYVVSKIGSSLFAGVIIFKIVAGWGIWQSLPAIVLMTAIYTVAGGLTAVMLTDTIQMFIFLTGGLLGTYLSLNLVGGISGLFVAFDEAGLTEFSHLLRPVTDSEFPWPGMLFGIPVVSIWYWCVDQEMAQRVLSAPNISEARLGAGFAGLLKVLPVFITVFPGMVARALFELCTMNQGHSDWCSVNLRDPHVADGAYPLLVIKEFPQGIRGIMVASFLAAMMSSLSAVLNSASTIFTYDIYQRFQSTRGVEVPSKSLVLVGRITTVVMSMLAFLWVPVIAAQPEGLYVCTQTAMTHLAPPVSALFVSGLFFGRSNGQGGLIGLLTGTGVGISRLVLYFVFARQCSEQVENGHQILTWSNFFFCLNFNYFAIVLFCFTLLVINTTSFFFPPPKHQKTNDTMVEWSCCKNRSKENTVNGGDESQEPFLGEDLKSGGDVEQIDPDRSDSHGVTTSCQRKKPVISQILGVAVVVSLSSLIAYFR